MRNLFTSIFLFAVVSAPWVLPAQTNGLELAEVRETVLANHPTVRESLQRIEAAEAALGQATSAYLPQLSVHGSYGQVDTSMHPDFDVQNRYADSLRQANGSLRGSWLLFDGFARRARTLASTYNVQLMQEAADETRRLLTLSATVSFRQAQLAAESMRIADQDQQFNRALEEDARKRYHAGATPEADMHNFSIRSDLRRRIDEAETARAVFERQEQIYSLTTSVRESVEKSYKAGVAPITRLNEAQTDLVRTKGAYANAFIAYQLSLNTLEIETGRVLETLGQGTSNARSRSRS